MWHAGTYPEDGDQTAVAVDTTAHSPSSWVWFGLVGGMVIVSGVHSTATRQAALQ